MVEKTSQLKRVIRRYCDELDKMGVHPQRVLLYGSQVGGNAEEGSDIDLIVISSDWDSHSMRERLEILGVAAARILEPIQAQGFTQVEISTHQIMPFWEQVIHEQAVLV